MRAGKLNQRISIISPHSTSRSAAGAPVVTYSTALKDIWAQVEPLGGRESFHGSYRWADSDIRVTIRYTTVTIEPRYNIVWQGSTYNIQGVVDSSAAHKELVIMAIKTT
jgi:SPP1 family predicted phage head-tail adaptor